MAPEVIERERLEATVLAPILRPSRLYDLGLILLGLITLWGVYAWSVQLRQGLVITGMRDQVPWGLYIGNLVFFIGISYGGTLVSAVLRVTKAEWRRPITRIAEAISVAALVVGGVQIVFDLGRPERFLNLFLYGRLQSPLIWDVVAISMYFVACVIYFALPLLPDVALLRDRLAGTVPAWQRWFYTFLAAQWTGTPEQRERLARAMNILAVLIIPLAVSVHTVLAWVFSMTLRPGWNSTAFGPYFVAGAVFSGIAAVVLAMGFFRRLFHLEEYLTAKHFRYVGYLLLTLNLVYIYFTFGEYLTMMYKLAGEEKELLQALFTGRDSPLFWSFVFGGLIMPALLVALPWTRTILGIQVASALVLAGMWLKRFLIVVPSLQVPLMPLEFGRYVPTWVEWSIMLGSVSAFLLLYGIIGRLFPLISIWEMVGEQETAPAEAAVQARRLMFPQPAFEGPRAVASGEE